MNRSIQAFAFAIILLGLTATRARADLNIALGNDYNLAPGGIGTIDITVTSSNNTDTLAAFSLELQITQVSGASVLQFTTSQPDPYGNSSYVFYNESFDAANSLPFWNLSSPPSPFLTILSDQDSDSSTQGYVSIPNTPGGSHTYLATVQFQAPQGANQGDTFLISLVPPNYDVNNSNFTYFAYDQNYDLLNYTSTGGTVMISSVPEPSSLTVVALSGLSGLLWCCWRGRKQGHSKNSPLATSIDRR